MRSQFAIEMSTARELAAAWKAAAVAKGFEDLTTQR
jgi:hypothetical protein